MKAKCIKNFKNTTKNIVEGDVLNVQKYLSGNVIIYDEKLLCDVGSGVQKEYFELIEDDSIMDYERMWNELKNQVDNKYKEMKMEYESVRDMSTKESSYDTGLHFGSYLATNLISRLMEKLEENSE